MASTDPEAEARGWLSHFAALLDEVGVRAVLIGGQARNFWTEPRSTADYDFTLEPNADRISALVSRLRAEGYRSRREQGVGLPSGPDFVQMQNPVTGDQIDFQVAKTEYQSLVIERGRKLDKAQFLSIATPEDLIVLKLIANRSKDHADILALGVLPGLDWAYVERWAEIWSVLEPLRELREALDQEADRLKHLYS